MAHGVFLNKSILTTRPLTVEAQACGGPVSTSRQQLNDLIIMTFQTRLHAGSVLQWF